MSSHAKGRMQSKKGHKSFKGGSLFVHGRVFVNEDFCPTKVVYELVLN